MVKIISSILLAIVFLSCSAQQTESAASTITGNVVVVEKPFLMKALNRERNIRIYLPTDYDTSDKYYPVLYMHDGQNLFDAVTSYVGEWQVDETLEELKLDLIVVGIDNGGEKRITELNPWDHEKYGSGEGRAYIDFIVDQIKPYIDSIYRTKSDRLNTGIMGSSLGGFISHYAILQYPEVFSKAGIFSPSYWIYDQVFEWTELNMPLTDAKLYIIVGGNEGTNMEKPAKKMASLLLDSGHAQDQLFFQTVKGGEHSEIFWRQQFAQAVQWLFE